MTAHEFAEKEAKILGKIPFVFHSALSTYAYEKGNGFHEEILNVLTELVKILEEPIEDYQQEILERHDY